MDLPILEINGDTFDFQDPSVALDKIRELTGGWLAPVDPEKIRKAVYSEEDILAISPMIVQPSGKLRWWIMHVTNHPENNVRPIDRMRKADEH